MGKTRIIAETGAGQHGVATATACALLGLECIVYMGTEDMRRQRPNVQRMELLGARVAPVEAGARTLKEAVSAAIRDWVANVRGTHYVIGSAVGPAPFPVIVRDLQRVIGDEARAQILERDGRAAGARDRLRRRRLERDRHVRAVRRRRRRRARRRRGGGRGPGDRPPRRAADGRRPGGMGGVLHGAFSAIMQDEDGQILEAHSISAGLDYPGTGPEHAWLRDSGRARYEAVTDAAGAGRVPAPVGARGHHPGARVRARDRLGARQRGRRRDLVCLSGRGDKDLAEALPALGIVSGLAPQAPRAPHAPAASSGSPPRSTATGAARR